MFLTMWLLLLLPCVRGESPCKSELVLSLNVTTVLQSDVLLPCNFSPGLIGLNTTADIAAVWSHRTVTVDNLVEITLQGQTMYWKKYNRQIKTFSSVSASGNFSILLRNVTQSDEGLYQCDLFNGTGCRIAYQEMHLRFDDSPADGFLTWLITAGALGGGVVLLVFLITIFICAKQLQQLWTLPGITELSPRLGLDPPVSSIYSCVSYTVLVDNSKEGV
ncbi:uncharacterized protein [Hoplias malabaricus]|uniref:uncharacterized protein n=1 Tax=Hoplias malabaricus TaxID=27720 RepID=UPI00346378F2